MKPFCGFIFAFSFLLCGCVNTTLSSTKEFEEYPLRPANDGEMKKIEHCLSAVLHSERDYHKKEGSFVLRPAALNVDESCDGIQVVLHKRGKSGFLATAQFNVNESTVRWTMDETGHAEEAADSMNDNDLDL